MTSAELLAYNARQFAASLRLKGKSPPSDMHCPTGPESELHAQIMDECRRRGWQFFHGAMCERSHRTEGEPDFIIQVDGGRTLYVECKSVTGKLSPAQLAVAAHAAKLGHTVHVVRSISEFKTLTNTTDGGKTWLPCGVEE